MASGLTYPTSIQVQDDQLCVTARTAPTSPMKLAQCTVAPSASTAGTELGSTTRPTITFGGASGTPPVSANSASCTATAGANGTVVGVDIYDSAGTPVRKAFGQLGTSRAVVINDLLVYAIGGVTVSITSP